MNIKAWLVTGSKWWNDCVTLSEDSADARIASRKSTGDRKVPLVDASELSRAYALIEEMREASKRSLSLATAWSEYYQAKHKLDAVHPTHEAVIEYVRDVTARADAFLAERVK